MKRIIFPCMFLLMLAQAVFAAKPARGPRSLQKTATLDYEILFDVNRMSGLMRNNGIWFLDVAAGDWGLEWPKGSGNSPIYAGGQWISARVNGEIRLAGLIHDATEYQPGVIGADGSAANPRDPAYRWYVIGKGGEGDWNTWPADQGAPVDAGGKPLLLGDRTAFCVWNDMGQHLEFATNKLGVEVRQTVFAFNRADAMGDMVFIKWQMVNKSRSDWDSTYFSIWLDPDIGSGSDDLVGCDPSLGLGFCYNGTNEDQDYGAAPPASGIDFFQGPIVDSPGSAVTLPDGTVLQDKKMLKMTAFIFYNNNDSPQGEPQTSNDVWNYQRGFWRDNSMITDPAGSATAFMFNGDPEAGGGWLDTDAYDRRFLMTTGPFSMKKWEDADADGRAEFGEPGVQEIVACVMVARGSSNTNSVTKLKEIDALAQMAYDLDFNLSQAPPAPRVQVSPMPNEIVLTWDERSEFNEDGSPYESEDPIVANAVGDTVILDNTVKVIDDASYNFYGYSVYQYSDASGRDPVEIAHWDNGGSAGALPYSQPRFLRILQNRNGIVGNAGDRLFNGKTYYFGVMAHGYLEYGAPAVFNSPPAIVAAVPRYTAGVRYHAEFNDSLDVAQTGSSDGNTKVYVVDPSKMTGKPYRVTFNDDMTWNLLRGAEGDTVAKNQVNQNGDDAYNVYDGLLVKVSGPSLGINFNKQDPALTPPGYESSCWGWGISAADNGNRWITGFDALGSQSAFFGGLYNGIEYWGVAASRYVDVRLDFIRDPGPDSSNWSKAYVLRRDKVYAFEAVGWFPGKLWNISDPSAPERLNIAFVEDDRLAPANNVWDMGWDAAAQAYANASTRGNDERVWLLDSPYDAGTNAELKAADWYDGSTIGLMYHLFPAQRGTRAYLAADFSITVFAAKPNQPGDEYAFTAPPSSAAGPETVREDIRKINVAPNPYYGYHSGEMDAFDRWVQFTFLPAQATIRIFDLAGNLVRKLEKDDATTPFLRWDMKNEYGLPVASGVYVYHVSVPAIGEKLGKLAIFAPNERLDTY